jgi:hypothetical protein
VQTADDPREALTFERKAYGRDPGDFHIGLAPIAETCWFEGGEDDPAPRKDALLARAPADVWGEIEGSRPGQAEALRLIAGWLGVAAVEPPDAPLLAAARLVEDDLCLMEKRPEGWTLTAASLCSASFFTAADAVGLPLQNLHGPVPGFNDRFLDRVARIFDRLQPDQILERRNWSVVNSGELSLPRAAPVRARIAKIDPAFAADAIFVRSERQTIRRLPKTGGVLFTIRIWREPLRRILEEPVRRDAFAAAWRRAMTHPIDGMRAYKGFAGLDGLIAPLLERPAS